jgi:hypothetical protein
MWPADRARPPPWLAERRRLAPLSLVVRGDKEAIATALIELAEKATQLKVTPASRSM